MLGHQRTIHKVGTFYANDAWVVYFQVSFDGEVTEFKNIDLKDLMTDVPLP